MTTVPLPVKLGVRPEGRVLLDGAPDDFDLGPVPSGVVVHRRAGSAPYDVVLLFARDRSQLVRRWVALDPYVAVDGRLWVAWPKRASGVPPDLGDDVVRRFGLDAGRVDVKVCAVDQTWSGLCFVTRLRDRG